jgi:hypothetical protein
VYKSTDNGVTWTNMGPNIGDLFETEIFALATSATNPNLIFIGGNNFGVNGWASVIWRTTDGGTTWDNVYIGSFPDNFESFHNLFIDPNSNDQVIYAPMTSQVQGSILKSTDGGDTWSVISGGISGTNQWFGTLVCQPANSQELIAGVGGAGTNTTIWNSTDAGTSWSQSTLTLGTYSKIQDLCISPGNSDVVYAASGQDGVWLSTDNAFHWAANNDGLPAINISAFSRAWQSGPTWSLFASTTTNSVFRTTVFDPNVGIKPNGHPQNVSVYPNPTSGDITLTPGKGQVTDLKVEVYNSAGMLVRVYDPATPVLHLELPAGIYLCRVLSGDAAESVKVIVR